jgi:hypothetical protein
MRDTIEEQLAARLGALGDTVDEELPPPIDLEPRVARRRRSERATRRGMGAGIAAAIVAAVVSVAVVHGTGGGGSLRVATSSTTLAPVHDSLQAGTVMLSARGRYVVSLDANGRTNATMVQAHLGDITYARATDDHRALWYLSLKKGSRACGDVVRADIDGHASTIVTHAVAFDVSPDGSRLALYGGGDLAHDRCVPVSSGVQGRVVVVDLPTGSSSALTVGSLTSLRWSADGSYLVSVSCSSSTCSGYDVIDVPRIAGAPLTVESGAASASPTRLVHAARIAFGADGLYALEHVSPFPNQSAPDGPTVRIARIDPRSRASSILFSGASDLGLSQVVPTSVGTFVVATPKAAGAGLYRIDDGRLVLMRPLDHPGTFTPVAPLVPAG